MGHTSDLEPEPEPEPGQLAHHPAAAGSDYDPAPLVADAVEMPGTINLTQTDSAGPDSAGPDSAGPDSAEPGQRRDTTAPGGGRAHQLHAHTDASTVFTEVVKAGDAADHTAALP